MLKTKTCPSCNIDLTCGDTDAGACWCSDLPNIISLENSKGCLCQSCLAIKVKNRIDSFVLDFKNGTVDNIAPKYKTKNLIEGIDYYLENEFWVFTAWFHLKRGKCCGNECRHCPYSVT